ncbi:MAG: TolC family protein [Bacteriovorax sp.]|nr:TolC family protein [Bacteriovorax sp.]
MKPLIIVLMALNILCIEGFAEESETLTNSRIVSLKDAISLAKKNNLEIKSESYKSSIAATDLTLIRGEMLPKISAVAGVGPINGKTGNYAFYQDQKTWGAEWIGSIEAKIPLFVWGRGEDLKHAATLNTELNKLDVTKKQNEIIFKLKEAYYGWQYALSLLDFVSETQKDLEQAVNALSEKKEKKEDILRLEVFKYQVEEKKLEIEKTVKLAQMGVNFYLGEELKLEDKNKVQNERQWIEMDTRELKTLSYYLDLMNLGAPDLQKVDLGIQAKSDLLSSEKKAALPVVGALVKYDYAQTNQRTAQNNPFIYDPYNHSSFAAGIGLTWDIDFGVGQSKRDKLVLEIAELKSKQVYAKEGLKVLLNKSYMEVEEAQARAETLKKAYKSAKKWLTNIETSVGLGLTPAKDIIDAYTTRALVFKDYYESLYRYQMSWAHLSEAAGQEVDPLLN